MTWPHPYRRGRGKDLLAPEHTRQSGSISTAVLCLWGNWCRGAGVGRKARHGPSRLNERESVDHLS